MKVNAEPSLKGHHHFPAAQGTSLLTAEVAVSPGHCEMKQCLECAPNQGDLKLCKDFKEVLKQGRFANGVA